MHRLVAADCFCGAGGISLGLKNASFDVRSAFDFNERAIQTYQNNLGSAGFVADVTNVSARTLGFYEPYECDLLVGGPPCQGFSRQRRGSKDDPRNQLIFEFLRLIDEVRPRCFLMENVAAMTSGEGKKILEEFRTQAEHLGYIFSISKIDAADFGVPQRRKRVFIFGYSSMYANQFQFPSPTHCKDDYSTVKDAIGDLPCPFQDPEAAKNFFNHQRDNISDLNRLRISHVPEGGGRADIPPHLRLACHAVDVETSGHRGVYGRVSWNDVSGTITTKCNSFTRGRFAHPVENRNLTMREVARLQTFPDSFQFFGGKVDTAHQIGNAVPPMLAEALGNAIRDFQSKTKFGRHKLNAA